MRKILSLILALLLAALPALGEHSREEVRAAYRALPDAPEASPFASAPSVATPYETGALTDAARQDALQWLNFLRWLAGLGAVTDSAIYDFHCQHGAVLLAALNYVDHNAPCPADMEPDFYDAAHLGTASSNIAKLAWQRPAILRDGIEYFFRDDGEANLPALGHRRWALSPLMAATGFGAACSETGASYVFMYAHDTGAAGVEWDHVAWPAAGAFPASLMHRDLAWSITLNPVCYDLAASRPVVTLAGADGSLFRFHPTTGGGDGYCALGPDGYGSGPCLVFRPDFTGTDFTDYQQNQRWTVTVDGLVDGSGHPAPLSYTVEMISLWAEDAAAVELSRLTATLAPGETLALTARVLPDYADDLRVIWTSSDESVAIVNADGTVTALAPGQCQIIAATTNGRQDACELTVSEK